MSNYHTHATNPRTGKREPCEMLDDYFSNHQHAVRFADGTLYHEDVVCFENCESADEKCEMCRDRLSDGWGVAESFEHLLANSALAKAAYDHAFDCYQPESIRAKHVAIQLAELNKRAMAIISNAIMHGMPITKEVAAVRNAIVCSDQLGASDE